MKILADDKIPLVQELFGSVAELQLKAGTEITRNDLTDVDILLVRTVTHVNQQLLAGTTVRFVGSATAGIDHLDTEYLRQAGIQWCYAKGANANAVVNYVLACKAALQQAGKLSPEPKIGIIGAGAIGSQVAKAVAKTSHQLLLNDPPRAESETDFISTPLSELVDLDLISIHTPLSRTGQYPSHHLIDESFLKALKPGCILINSARGGVIDEQALLKLTSLPTLCLDVWEHEPHINLKLMQQCFIATPHIAGYTLEAKHRATQMLYQALQPLLNWPILTFANAEPNSKPKINEDILALYNPLSDSTTMKQTLSSATDVAHSFEALRREYRLRREFC